MIPFSLLARPPPCPTLFPTRRSSDLDPSQWLVGQDCLVLHPMSDSLCRHPAGGDDEDVDALRCRSEEHTSELQSHVNLVCRLLLEKKKIQPNASPGHR